MKYRIPKIGEVYKYLHGRSIHWVEVIAIDGDLITIEWNLCGYDKPRKWVSKYRYTEDIGEFYNNLV